MKDLKKIISWQIAGVAIGMIVIFCLTYFAPVSNAGSDARFSLLTSQAILEHQTVKLTPYASEVTLEGSYQITMLEGDAYYAYPLGSPIFALPFVWVALQQGQSMVQLDDDFALQNLLSAIICTLIFLCVYLICSRYLSPQWSLGISLISMLGSSLISTLGTAFWNSGTALLFILIGLYLLTKEETPAYKLGIVLFLAYLCRPTAALFILLTFAYLLRYDRPALIRTASVSGLLLVGFLLFSYQEYGSWLPIYYQPSYLKNDPSVTYLSVLYGLLFSPGRGLFVYSPMFLLVLGAILWQVRQTKLPRLTWLALAWVTLHLLMVSRFGHWWGGHSFGPRLLIDMVLPLVLLTAVALKYTKNPVFLGAYAITSLVAIMIHTGMGLYNPATFDWNGDIPPNIDHAPQYLFDWQYPQFLATTEALCERNQHYYEQVLIDKRAHLTAITSGNISLTEANNSQVIARPSDWYVITFEQPTEPINYEDWAHHVYFPAVYQEYFSKGHILFVGWGWSNGAQVGMYCPTAEIQFASPNTSTSQEYQIQIRTQNGTGVDVIWNDQPLGTLNQSETTFTLLADSWHEKEPNVLRFEQTSDQQLILEGITFIDNATK